MKETDIPDFNIFMICKKINTEAYRDVPDGYHIRKLKHKELKLWMEFPFDKPDDKVRYLNFMQEFFDKVYAKKVSEFYNRCLVICDNKDKPVGTCFAWKAYDRFWTIHWYKIEKLEENKGLGRALLTQVMKSVPEKEMPIYLHTQPGSFRAIKIYSDFGFKVIKDKKIGNRKNQFKLAKKYLKHFMKERYKSIKFDRTDGELDKCAALYEYNEF